jgi:hypothetical protein
MRNPGIYENIDIDEYHSEAGISSSGISLILDCPKRYWYEYNHAEELSDSSAKAYKLGRAFHMFCLEKHKFEESYLLMQDKVNLTTKVGKEAMERAISEARGREVIRAEDWSNVLSMSKSVCEHSLWSRIGAYKAEHSIYWDNHLGVRLRARPDLFTDSLIIDLKTTDSIANFSKSIYNFGYHRQAAMQIDGLHQLDGKKRTFAFFVVEKKAPFLTACFVLDDEAIQQGRREYQDGASIYKECMDSGVWPGYEEQFQMISLPHWAVKQEDASNE